MKQCLLVQNLVKFFVQKKYHLFLIYIHVLAKGLDSSVKLFSDETSIFSIVKDANKSSGDIINLPNVL